MMQATDAIPHSNIWQ